MDPSSSSSLSSTIAYVVDPKKEEKKTCIPFTSHGYLCVRTVGGKPCTVGTVRSSRSKDAYDREHDRTTHTQVRSCFCYSRRSTLLDGTQSCELIASDDDIYHNGLLGRRSWSRCVCGDRGGSSSTNRKSGYVSSIFVFIFWFCVVLFLLVSLYVQIFVRCCSSSSTNRKSGYVRVGHDDESRKMRRRRRRRTTSVGKKGDRVEYTAVNLMDDDDDDDDDGL